MLRVLQNLSPVSLLFLLLYFAGLSVHAYLQPFQATFENTTPAAELLFNRWIGFQNIPPEVLRILVFCSVFLQGILLCFFLQYFKIVSKFSLIPAAVYYLFCFLFDVFIAFYPLLLINFIFFWLIFLLFTMYNKSKIDTAFFNTGFLLSLITLIYFPAVVLIFFCLFVFGQLRSTALREIVLFFSAFVVTYFLTATAFFWFDQFPDFVNLFPLPTQFTVFTNTFDIILIIKLLLASMLLITSFIFLNTRYSSVLIQIRKYFSCFIGYGLIMLLSAFFTQPFSLQNLYPLVFPGSVLVGYFFMNLKNREAAEIIHLALLGIVLLFQYINFAE